MSVAVSSLNTSFLRDNYDNNDNYDNYISATLFIDLNLIEDGCTWNEFFYLNQFWLNNKIQN